MIIDTTTLVQRHNALEGSVLKTQIDLLDAAANHLSDKFDQIDGHHKWALIDGESTHQLESYQKSQGELLVTLKFHSNHNDEWIQFIGWETQKEFHVRACYLTHYSPAHVVATVLKFLEQI